MAMANFIFHVITLVSVEPRYDKLMQAARVQQRTGNSGHGAT